MVLEGYGGSGESSTDDDGQVCSTDPAAAADSGIDLKKLLSSASSQSRGPNFSRQVMTHLRLLQANLQQLKVTLSLLFTRAPASTNLDCNCMTNTCMRHYLDEKK